MSDETIRKTMDELVRKRKARTNAEIAAKLRKFAEVLIGATNPDDPRSEVDAADLIDGSDIDAIIDAADRLTKVTR